MKSDKSDSLKGALYGAAIGDALGAPFEFDTPVPPEPFSYVKGHAFYKEDLSGEWTDDTAQLLCLIRARAAVKSLEEFPKAFAKELVYWFQTDGRGCGLLTNRVLSDVAFPHFPLEVAHDAWVESGRNSAPNGAVMRTAGAILAHGAVLEKRWETLKLTELACQVTHADPRCLVSCKAVNIALSYVINFGQDGFSPLKGALEHGVDVVPQPDKHWFEALTLLELQLPTQAGFTYKCAGAGFWALRQLDNRGISGGNFRQILKELILAGGDTDTNAAVAGALLGGALGFKNLPKDLIRGLKRKEELEEGLALCYKEVV